MNNMQDVVEIFTDGACKGNPGVGGWGVLLRTKGKERELFGGEAHTTNNRMELMAAIRGLEGLSKSCEVLLRSDSQYVVKGIQSWLKDWKRRGWKKADGKPVLNADLWQALDAQLLRHQVEARWVKGHAGHPENERVDRLANAAAQLA